MSYTAQAVGGAFSPKAMAVRLASRYRVFMWLLLPLTLGAGTLVLWLVSLGWPRSLDERALTLRSGKQIPWPSIDRIGVLKVESSSSTRTVHLKIYHTGGMCWIPVSCLDEGEHIANEIRRRHRQANR